MSVDPCLQKIPPRKLEPVPTKIEPVTGDRYVRTEVNYYEIPELDKLFHAPDYIPIATWGEFSLLDERWDSVFIERFGFEYDSYKSTGDRASAPVPISAQLLHMGKSYCRKIRKSKIDICGVITWANWTRIEPCWLIVNSVDAFWLRSEEELGLQH